MMIMVGAGGVPIAYALWISMRDLELIRPESSFIGIDNFVALIQDGEFRHAVIFTLGYALASTIIELILGFAIARMLADKQVGAGFSSTIRVLLMLPYIAAPVVMAYMFKTLIFDPTFGYMNAVLNSLGLPSLLVFEGTLGPIIALIAVDVLLRTAFVVLIVYAGMVAINQEINEAVQLDGASALQAIRHVIVPILKPVLIVAFTFRFLDALKVFDEVYVLTQGGPGTTTQSLSLFSVNKAFSEFHLGYATAATILFTIVALTITMFLTRTKAFS